MDKVFKNYIKSFENLNKNNIHSLINLCSDDIIFIDPFNKIKGRKKLEKILQTMFQKIQDPTFKVIYFISDSKQKIVKWRFSGSVFKKYVEFTGISEIQIKKGLVVKHEDFWDSGRNFYCNIPLIGNLFKKINQD